MRVRWNSAEQHALDNIYHMDWSQTYSKSKFCEPIPGKPRDRNGATASAFADHARELVKEVDWGRRGNDAESSDDDFFVARDRYVCVCSLY